MAETAYDRLAPYLGSDEYIKIIDFEGNVAYFKVSRREPLGNMYVQFASATATLASGANTGSFVGFDFLQPARENRLYQVTAQIALIDIGSQKLLDTREIPAMINLEVENPSGTRRYGTATTQTNLVMNTITNSVGGVSGGVIPPFLQETRDDPSHVYDMWIIFGSYPAFRVVNNTTGLAPLGTSHNAYILTFGMKYILIDVSADEYQALVNREFDYRAITVGGIPVVTTRA